MKTDQTKYMCSRVLQAVDALIPQPAVAAVETIQLELELELNPGGVETSPARRRP